MMSQIPCKQSRIVTSCCVAVQSIFIKRIAEFTTEETLFNSRNVSRLVKSWDGFDLVIGKECMQ